MRIDVKDFCTIEQAKKLAFLGVKQESSYYWCNNYFGEPINKWFIGKNEPALFSFSAFGVEELNKLIGDDISFCTSVEIAGETIFITKLDVSPKRIASKFEAQMKADFLIYKIELKNAYENLRLKYLYEDFLK